MFKLTILNMKHKLFDFFVDSIAQVAIEVIPSSAVLLQMRLEITRCVQTLVAERTMVLEIPLAVFHHMKF